MWRRTNVAVVLNRVEANRVKRLVLAMLSGHANQNGDGQDGIATKTIKKIQINNNKSSNQK